MPNSIYKDLIDLKLISDSSYYEFNHRTRDDKNLKVFRDKITGVIFIKDYYVGLEYYEDDPKESVFYFEREKDNRRRLNDFKQFYVDKTILDFGCEYGDFLLSTRDLVHKSYGIELTKSLVDKLKKENLEVENDLNFIADNSLDTLFCFHCLEHIENQRNILKLMHRKLKVGGKIVIEVPHANDFLLHNSKDFKNYTLWSEHLILHTYQSLKVFLEDASFNEIFIKGFQRYSLANHLYWLSDGKPGGHKKNFSLVFDNEVEGKYSDSLISASLSDTLVAIATKF